MTADGTPTPGPATEWMTTRQTAAYLQMSYSYVRELIAAGNIRSTKIGTAGRSSDRRVHRLWADAYLESRATGGNAAAAQATALPSRSERTPA